MKAQELADRLNEVIDRLPRIATTLLMHDILIDAAELQRTGSFDGPFPREGESSLAPGRRRLPVVVSVAPWRMSVANLVNCLHDEPLCRVWMKVDEQGKGHFEVDACG